MLCSWARHFTLTVPPSTQEYKWVPANCWGNLTNCWGVTCDGLASRPGGVEILLAASCYGNQVKLLPDEPVFAPKASLGADWLIAAGAYPGLSKSILPGRVLVHCRSLRRSLLGFPNNSVPIYIPEWRETL